MQFFTRNINNYMKYMMYNEKINKKSFYHDILLIYLRLYISNN